jgi:recombination endonuclease VII
MKAAARLSQLKNVYGLTPQDLATLVKKQEGLCAICLEEKPLGVDHDHVTQRVRGLLCKTCNFGLGSFHDDASKLLAAVIYLQEQS